jgi:hypothetical protein
MSAGTDADFLLMGAALLTILGLGLVVFRILELGDAFEAVVIANLRFWMVGAMLNVSQRVLLGVE